MLSELQEFLFHVLIERERESFPVDYERRVLLLLSPLLHKRWLSEMQKLFNVVITAIYPFY